MPAGRIFSTPPPLQKSTATSLVGFYGERGVRGKAPASPLRPPTLHLQPLTWMVKTLVRPVYTYMTLRHIEPQNLYTTPPVDGMKVSWKPCK